MLGDLIYEAKGKVTAIRGVKCWNTKDRRSTITQNGTLKGGIRGYKYTLLIGAFPDLEEHIMLKVKAFSWQKMMVLKW